MIQLPQHRFKFIKEHKMIFAGVIIGIIGLIIIILAILGQLDCEDTQIREGVRKTCDCQGLEITVKSSTNSGEQKTICLGKISNPKTYTK